MAVIDQRNLAVTEYPEVGAFRVHWAPTQLRPLTDEPGPYRFDAPHNEYQVWYLATSLRGSLLEVLDHHRPNAAAETAIQSVTNLSGNDVLEDEPAGLVPNRWLSIQLVTTGNLSAPNEFTDVTDPAVMSYLNDNEDVRRVLAEPEIRNALGESVRIDLGTICAGGAKTGRRITRAVSKAIYALPSAPTGISYVTRFDPDERCWAVFADRATVDFSDTGPLDPTNAVHRAAVKNVATLYGLTLPAEWRR
jgi:hypothetical protein